MTPRAQRFGNQTVTFVSKAPTGEPGPLGTRAVVEVLTDVAYCLHHPRQASGRGAGLAMAEQQPEIGVSVATEWWQTTAPADSAVLAAKPSDVIRVNGQDFQIIAGVKPFVDESGRVFKVTILSERQDIG